MRNRSPHVPSRPLVRTITLRSIAAAGLFVGWLSGPALAQDNPAAAAPKAAASAAEAFPEGKFLDGETVGVGVLRMEPVRKSSFYAALRKSGALRMYDQGLVQIGTGLEHLDRISIAVDQNFVDFMAQQAGFAVADQPPTVSAHEMQSRVRQMALAFHNYHDSYGRLPRADGDGEGRKTGLSWRVHLLPFLEEAPLYARFHLDEPWDSEHNKPLIEKMPKVFGAPGVTEPGKTSFHVFTGKNTPFDGKQGKKFTDFTDGMSNTLLMIAAAPETAVEWTKPGGLEFDPRTCRDLLGKIKVSGFFAVMADGAPRPIPSSISAEQLAPIVQLNDGKQAELPDQVPISPPAPTMILAFSKPYDQSRIPRRFPPEKVGTQEMHLFGNYAGWFVSDRIMVMSPPQTLRRMIANHESKTPTVPSIAAHLPAESDGALAFDLASQAKLLEAIIRKHPLAEVFQPVTILSVQANVSQPVGGTLIELAATTPDPAEAESLADTLTPGLDQLKTSLGKLPIPTPTPAFEKAKTLALAAVATATLKPDGSRVVLRIPVPAALDPLVELFGPGMARQGDQITEATERRNRMKAVALAFHNHESAFGHFPGAGRKGPDDKIGLSWRVHLLPYIGQAELYKKFALDEPWDSPHNKPLSEKMPRAYFTPGVDKPGHTAIHVLIGKGAPFAEDRAPKLRDFTDGTSNTILIVEAGLDKAEIWTKPGGLDFDPGNPIEAMGTLSGQTLLTATADGAIRSIAKTINADILRRMIQFQDGEPLELPPAPRQ